MWNIAQRDNSTHPTKPARKLRQFEQGLGSTIANQDLILSVR